MRCAGISRPLRNAAVTSPAVPAGVLARSDGAESSGLPAAHRTTLTASSMCSPARWTEQPRRVPYAERAQCENNACGQNCTEFFALPAQVWAHGRRAIHIRSPRACNLQPVPGPDALARCCAKRSVVLMRQSALQPYGSRYLASVLGPSPLRSVAAFRHLASAALRAIALRLAGDSLTILASALSCAIRE